MRHLVVLALLASCGVNTNPPIALTFDACDPLVLTSTVASSGQLDGMAAGQALWHARGARGLGLLAGATLDVRFQAAAYAYHGLYDDKGGVIYINASLTEPSLEIVIAHELGHAFGLFHVTDRPSVMSPGNLTTPPTDDDQHALAELWGTCE